MGLKTKLQKKYAGILVFCVIFAGLGAYLLINGFAATAPVTSANIWMDADGGSCSYSSTQVAYNSSTACADFNTACSKIPAGAAVIVPVKGGAYTSGKTSLSNCKPTGKITFQEVSGENVTTNGVYAQDTNNVTVDGLYIDISNNGNGAGSYFVCTQNITLKGVEIEGDHSQGTSYGDAVQVWPRDDDSKPLCYNKNFTLDSVYIHDLHTYVPAEDNHTDCVQAAASEGLNILNSRLVNCGTQSFQLNADSWPCNYTPNCASLTDVKIENSWVGTGGTIGGMTNFSARNNVFINAPNFDPAVIKGTKVITGNILDLPQSYHCGVYSGKGVSSSVTFKYNIADVDCPAGTNSIKVTNLNSLFVNASISNADTWDLHLADNNAAVGAMPFSLAPTTDYDGDARPQTGNVDIGSDQYNSTPVPTGPTANLWVNTTAGSSPARCDTPCAYDRDKAYGSLNAAYQAARGGDIIRVIPGSYGGQTITNSPTVNNDAQMVKILSAGNGQVSFTGEVKIIANFVTFDGQSNTAPYDFKNDNYVLQIGESGNEGVHDVTVKNFDGRNFWIKAAHHITINGGDWGPSVACRAGTFPGSQLENQITGTSGIGSTPHDIKLDGLLIHDQNTDNPTACHTGGLIFQGGYNIEIKNNIFRQNAIYDILFDDFTGTFRTDAITIENNWFGPPVEPYTVDPSGATISPAQADIQVKWNGVAAKDWLVRYNSFGSGLALAWGGSPPSWSNVRVLGNTGGNTWRGASWDTCAGAGIGATIKYNAFVGIDNLGSSGASTPTCGDNTNISLGKVSGYGLSSTYPYASTSNTDIDFHLKTTTAAKDLVTQTTGDYALATDIDGDTRPKGTSNDAGADEAITSTSAKPGDTNNDNLVNIIDLSTLLSRWNTNFPAADFNSDGTVSIVDLSILLSNYGK